MSVARSQAKLLPLSQWLQTLVSQIHRENVMDLEEDEFLDKRSL